MTYYDEIAAGYNELHKAEQLQKLSFIEDLDIIRPTDTLLDVGCGTGFSLDYFTVRKATGIDPAKQLIEQYDGRQRIMLGNAEDLPFEDESFDVVISVTAIQNFEHIRRGLEEIHRVGSGRWVLTFLKASNKADNILALIKEIFHDYKRGVYEQEIDMIVVIS